MVISTRLRLQRRGMAFTGISYRILEDRAAELLCL